MAGFHDSTDFIEPASDGSASSSVAWGGGVGDADADTDADADPFAGGSSSSDYASSIADGSLVGSLTSSVYGHVYENGRRYHAYKPGRYPLPNDDLEYQREAVRNALFTDLLGGKLHMAPIGDQPQKIIDIGTGFGDWAIDAGDRYPSARVVGVDLSPIQPSWVPGNVEFIIDDVEDSAWIHGSGYDFAHLRLMAAILQNLERVLGHVFEHLKPGGWVEIQDIVPHVGCDDGTMPADHAVDRFYRLLAVVQKHKSGWDLSAAENLPGQLERLGFVNIQRKIHHVPIGFWPKDKNRMKHAFFFREILSGLLIALQAKPFTGDDPEVGLDKHEIDTLFNGVRASLSDKSVHAYIPFHFVWAQKPHDAPAAPASPA